LKRFENSYELPQPLDVLRKSDVLKQRMRFVLELDETPAPDILWSQRAYE
jgi:hypothetical protein